MKIIGLSGRAESGKNTVADMMVEMCHDSGLSVTTRAFADPVKLMVERLNPIVAHTVTPVDDGDEVHPVRISDLLDMYEDPAFNFTWSQRWDFIKVRPEVRALLQRMGTEAGRGTLGDDVWVDLMHRRILKDEAQDIDVVIITDTRFESEQRLIKSLDDSRLVLIERPTKNSLGVNSTHLSETSLNTSLTDVTLNNDGDLDELREKVRFELNSFLAR